MMNKVDNNFNTFCVKYSLVFGPKIKTPRHKKPVACIRMKGINVLSPDELPSSGKE